MTFSVNVGNFFYFVYTYSGTLCCGLSGGGEVCECIFRCPQLFFGAFRFTQAQVCAIINMSLYHICITVDGITGRSSSCTIYLEWKWLSLSEK